MPEGTPTDWNEYEWEQALRESDQYASRYMRLLRRFSDLPGGQDLIAERMESASTALPTCDFDCDSCEHRWNCEFAMPHDWMLGEIPDIDEDEEDLLDDENDDGGLLYEKDVTFALLRQMTLGWCNVYAAVLPAEQRGPALTVLYHLGRALGNLAYTLEETDAEQPDAGIAFLKRCQNHLNEALGIMNRLGQESARHERLMKALRKHLMEAREGVLRHLEKRRRP
ncbi:MAG: hypothetical protein ACOCWJ_00930 [Verrucomicrobiota bacterium]